MQAAESTGKRVCLFDGKTPNNWTVLTCEATVDNGDLFLKSGNGLVQSVRKYANGFNNACKKKPFATAKPPHLSSQRLVHRRTSRMAPRTGAQLDTRAKSRKGRSRIARRFNAGWAGNKGQAPSGAAESDSCNAAFCRPYGTLPSRAAFPALKCRAILVRPSGT